MRISDWSSDVCSSDLRQLPAGPLAFRPPIGVPDIRARGRQRRISDDECDDGSIAPGEQGRAVAAVDRRGGAACDRGGRRLVADPGERFRSRQGGCGAEPDRRGYRADQRYTPPVRRYGALPRGTAAAAGPGRGSRAIAIGTTEE